MGNDYDKIIKENIEAVILPLMEKLTGLPQPIKLENIPDELQLTLERKPDFSRIATDSANVRYLLHIEFQVADDLHMVLRMQTYRALFQEIYRLPVKQFVFYLGRKKPKMVSRIANLIPGDENNFAFSLINTQRYDYRNLLESQIPEEIIFAILGDFKNEHAEKIVSNILKRLIQISPDKKKIQRYVQQLLVLSKLRNLEAETLKQTEAMPIEFDINKDVVYQKGKAEGRSEGRSEGLSEGKKMVIVEMLKDGSLSLQKIATYARVSVDEVVAIQQEISNTK
jgi:predicted transposase/invertase (TIGR01784 family)